MKNSPADCDSFRQGNRLLRLGSFINLSRNILDSCIYIQSRTGQRRQRRVNELLPDAIIFHGVEGVIKARGSPEMCLSTTRPDNNLGVQTKTLHSHGDFDGRGIIIMTSRQRPDINKITER